ncbi:MAG TPA: M48 family metallopeptidase [Candidatus Tectomicrobia bacterium]|nr:M48 family metallopeptidase [Candidatus Tectomicrobia bacterium]
MPPSLSLAGRAVLAVVLMLGFYILAFAISGGLLYIPYAQWTYAGRLSPKLLIFSLLGAGIILWSILPRRDRFVPPGPQLEPKEHPKLFETLAGIAQATKQQMPAEVYLVADVNAWVMDRGGIMGFGSRRVMGLGLPLLQALSVSQLRAVLAHEFGHFHGGDTKLGPWVYKTRAAIGRTLQGLAAYSSLLQKPFLWYGKAFLRITHAVSRRQEFTADALAARIVGPHPLIEGLKRTHSAALAFDGYWHNDVAPVLSRGFHPPVVEGFRRYLTSSRIAAAISSSLDREMAEGQADPYDTHPPLRERIAAVRHVPNAETTGNDLPAISLVQDVEGLEARLIRATADEPTAQVLPLLAWDDVGKKVWVPAWEAYTGKYAEALAGNTLGALPALLQNVDAFSLRLRRCDGEDLGPEQRRQQVITTLGVALTVALSRNGWQPHVLPGDEVVCERNGTLIKPLDIVSKLASGELTPDAWHDLCVGAGIAELDLGGGSVVTRASPAGQQAA